MKRTFMLFLALALTAMLCLSACGGSDSSGYNGNPYDSNVIYKANESAAMQQAHNALTCALVMSNTGTVPSGTMIVLDYDNSADTLPDYGFLYNGNTLERCDLNTAAFAEMDTLIVSPDLIPQYSSADPMLENVLRAVTGIYNGAITVQNNGGSVKITIGSRAFDCYYSSEFSKNVAVFLNLNPND